jgi:hypothetical protein
LSKPFCFLKDVKSLKIINFSWGKNKERKRIASMLLLSFEAQLASPTKQLGCQSKIPTCRCLNLQAKNVLF